MEYFVIQPDDRSLFPLRLNLSEKEMDFPDPFVTYADYDENTDFYDYYYINKWFKHCFCVSDRLNELLEVYEDNIRKIPFFITDKKLQNQKIYWKIHMDAQDCLEITPHMRYDNLTVVKEKIKDKYVFKVSFDKQEYIIVSLHLAENILRKNMIEMKFVPVRLV